MEAAFFDTDQTRFLPGRCRSRLDTSAQGNRCTANISANFQHAAIRKSGENSRGAQGFQPQHGNTQNLIVPLPGCSLRSM